MQRIVLSKIISYFIGKERLPMLIVSKNINNEKNKFDAKTAAIRGFSIFGKDHQYLLDEKENINKELLMKFLNKFGKKNFNFWFH